MDKNLIKSDVSDLSLILRSQIIDQEINTQSTKK
jgi:hypothetical protein